MKQGFTDKLNRLGIPEDVSFEWLVDFAKRDFWSIEVYGNKYIARSFGDRQVSIYEPSKTFQGLQAIGKSPTEALLHLLVKIHAPDPQIDVADVESTMNELREVLV